MAPAFTIGLWGLSERKDNEIGDNVDEAFIFKSFVKAEFII